MPSGTTVYGHRAGLPKCRFNCEFLSFELRLWCKSHLFISENPNLKKKFGARAPQVAGLTPKKAIFAFSAIFKRAHNLLSDSNSL